MARWMAAYGGDKIGKQGSCSVRLTHRVGGGAAGFIVRADKNWAWVEAPSFRGAKRRADSMLKDCASGGAPQWERLKETLRRKGYL